MIDILQFRELCVEIRSEADALLAENGFDCVDNLILAVREEHLVKKLQKASGISLCFSFPDAQAVGEEDNYQDRQKGYIFVVDRVSPGQNNDEAELLSFRKLQRVMLAVREVLRQFYSDCLSVIPEESYKIEWEYQIFGGVNGLSMGFTFNNNDDWV